MNFGELDAGLNALDVVRLQRAADGTPTALMVDGAPVDLSDPLLITATVSPSGDSTGVQDSAALNAAVAAAITNGGGVVVLSEGIYYLASTVTISNASNVYLFATPGSVKLKLADNQAAASPGDMKNMVVMSGCSYCGVSGIDFDGNYQNQNLANLAMCFGDAAQGASGNRRDPFTMRYVGAGSAASMQISGNTLTTTCTGAAGDNLNIDLTAAGYDTIAELVSYIDGLAGYQATALHSTFGSQLSRRLYATTFADIKTATFGVNFANSSIATTHEIYGNCIMVKDSSYCSISKCDLSNAPHMGALITGNSSYNNFEFCSGSYNNWRAGEVWLNAGTESVGNRFINNTFKNSYHESIIVENTATVTHAAPGVCRSVITGNTVTLDDLAFNDGDHSGISLYNSPSNICTGNALFGCFIRIETLLSDYNVVSFNTLDGLNRHSTRPYVTRSVHVKNGVGNLVIGNVCNDAYYDAIRVEAGASKTTIQNNVISNMSEASRYPIYIAASSTNNILENNRIESCTNGINNLGTRTILNGVGQNGSNDPASAGNWNANGVEGVRVQWDNGASKKRLSQYSGGAWINYYAEP